MLLQQCQERVARRKDGHFRLQQEGVALREKAVDACEGFVGAHVVQEYSA